MRRFLDTTLDLSVDASDDFGFRVLRNNLHLFFSTLLHFACGYPRRGKSGAFSLGCARHLGQQERLDVLLGGVLAQVVVSTSLVPRKGLSYDVGVSCLGGCWLAQPSGGAVGCFGLGSILLSLLAESGDFGVAELRVLDCRGMLRSF